MGVLSKVTPAKSQSCYSEYDRVTAVSENGRPYIKGHICVAAFITRVCSLQLCHASPCEQEVSASASAESGAGGQKPGTCGVLCTSFPIEF